jgi:hypothetical protein
MECGAEEALGRSGIVKDFETAAKGIAWIHRRSDDADWYFVAADNKKATRFEASFAVAGRVPEIWNAEDGTRRVPSEWRVVDGRTFVTFDFPPKGSAFVVFRKEGMREVGKGKREEGNLVQKTVTISGPWQVSFPVDWYSGGTNTKTVSWAKLKDWTKDADTDIKYFSGTATYSKRIPVPRSLLHGSSIILDLGEVKDFAEVEVDGTTYPPLWRPPFKVDITDAVKNGERGTDNGEEDEIDISIRVTNLWPNRLIGDDALYEPDTEWVEVPRPKKRIEYGIKELPQWVKEGKPSPTGRHTFSTWRHWTKKDKLLSSGLLGPVALRIERGQDGD